MKNKKTIYQRNFGFKEIIGAILIVGIFVYISWLIIGPLFEIINKNLSPSGIVLKYFIIAYLAMTPLLLLFSLIFSFIGLIASKVKISRMNSNVELTNPYQYFRELPNEYGIGVTTLLFDSTIENSKDIIASILDLCAKKYISLTLNDNKYIIKTLKPIDENLLSNEKYILSSINDKNIVNINYQEWYNYCMGDGIDLQLFTHKEAKINYDTDNPKIITKITNIIYIILIFAIFFFLLIFGNKIIPKAYMFGALFLGYPVIWVTINLILISLQSLKGVYDSQMNNNMKRTKKGIEELQKLYSFKSFLNDFGNFADKKIDEIKIWDRYLSYAEVFGLTNVIMKTGYKELIDNNSFHIDNMDNISLDNIDYEDDIEDEPNDE